MALSFTPVFAVNAVASLTVGTTLIAAIFDKEQRVVDFIPSPAGNYNSGPAYTWPASWNGITITGGTTTAANIFPVVTALTMVTATDSNGNTGLGQVVLKLQPASGDVVLPASVLSYRLDPEAVILTVSGTTASAGSNTYGT